MWWTILEGFVLVMAVVYTISTIGNYALLIRGQRKHNIKAFNLLMPVLCWTVFLYMRGVL